MRTFRKRGAFMQVLWGAWARDVQYNGRESIGHSIDIIGIHDNIYYGSYSAFPIVVNLKAVVSYQAEQSEFNRTINQTLEILDLDGSAIFSQDWQLPIHEGDSPFRWYEVYDLQNIRFREPGQYELYILVNGEQRYSIPLWIITPKATYEDEERGIKVEGWNLEEVMNFINEQEIGKEQEESDKEGKE